MTNKELLEKITYLEAESVKVKEMAEAMKKRVDGGMFKPEEGEKYRFISGSGEAYQSKWYDDWVDSNRYEIGNCYPTQQAAEDAVRVLKLIQKARETQGGFIPDWDDGGQRKYYLYLYKGKIDIGSCFLLSQAPALSYWGDQMACRLFAKENYEELLWFFKNYKG